MYKSNEQPDADKYQLDYPENMEQVSDHEKASFSSLSSSRSFQTNHSKLISDYHIL